MGALVGIVRVCYYVAAEKLREDAQREQAEGHRLEEMTRHMTSLEMFQMFPAGTTPGAYCYRAEQYREQAEFLEARGDAVLYDYLVNRSIIFWSTRSMFEGS